MNKTIKLNHTAFVYISLITFAFLFFFFSLVHNYTSTASSSNTSVPAQQISQTVNSDNYTVEETADPFVTRVIQK